MYYDIAIFSQFIVACTGCIINAMDLKIFPNTIVLLKVDHFNPLTIRFSEANVHMCHKCILQTNHTIYTYKTIY